jgi:hypothetical protein
MSKYAVISFSGSLPHDQNVAQSFIAGYGDGLSYNDIEITTDDYKYCASRCIEILIRATTGIYVYQSDAEYYFNKYGILTVMPMGSNDYEELDSLQSIPKCIVSTGAGIENNETGYGNGLEFFDTEQIAEDAQHSSYSAGIIAGKLLKIKHESDKGWDDVRSAARETASGGGWNKYNGYGKINVSAAIEYLANGTNINASVERSPNEKLELRQPSGLYHKLKGWKIGRYYQL